MPSLSFLQAFIITSWRCVVDRRGEAVDAVGRVEGSVVGGSVVSVASFGKVVGTVVGSVVETVVGTVVGSVGGRVVQSLFRVQFVVLD